MWKEPSAGVPLVDASEVRLPQPALVDVVEPESIGDELGIQPGDRLLSINGVRPRDLIDLQFLVCAEELTLEVQDPDAVRARLKQAIAELARDGRATESREKQPAG